jgi:hypothetical protein
MSGRVDLHTPIFSYCYSVSSLSSGVQDNAKLIGIWLIVGTSFENPYNILNLLKSACSKARVQRIWAAAHGPVCMRA